MENDGCLRLLLLFSVTAWMLVACGGPSPAEVDTQAERIGAPIVATWRASAPTHTPRPTRTSTPTATFTPTRTSTPRPTATPRPTSAPRPTRTPTPLPRPRSTPAPASTPTPTEAVSAEPLDFDPPMQVDNYRPGPGTWFVTVSIDIRGGVPPFTVSHDLMERQTSSRHVSFEYTSSQCALIHSITVTSADGQTVSHDYYIRAPWCEE